MSQNLRKKIVIVGPVFPYRGGNSLFVSYLYDSLKENFDVKIFNYKLLYPSFLFPGTTQFDESETVIKKAPSERIVNSINPYNWFSTADKIIEEKADMVVFDWWHPFFGPCHYTISRLISGRYKGKILFITENFVSHEGNAIDRILTKIGLSNADSFMALSNIVADELRSIAGSRKIYRSELPVYNCYNSKENLSIEEAKKKLGINPADKVLLFFGYVRKYKGLDILINALPSLKKEFPGIKLLIVGEFYDDPAVYTSRIKELGIDGDVILVNKFVANEEVSQYYEAADIVVLPYRSATQSGILNVAYGFLKPVVVTDVGGLAEFVKNKETGIVVNPGDPGEIVKGVDELFALMEISDLRENISEYIRGNKFNMLPSLFNEIIENSER